MKRHHGLSEKVLDQIVGVFAHFPELEKAVLFGSRAKGTHKRGSDIDISLVGSALDWRKVGEIYDELDDLMLPYRFSLIVFDKHTDPDVAAHIERVGIPLFLREYSKAELA
jgi:uncharacterized protein